MSKFRVLNVILSLVLVLAMLAGCGTAAQTTTTAAQTTTTAAQTTTTAQPTATKVETSPSAPAQVTITVWTWYTEQLKTSVIPAFEKKYPNVKVDGITMPSEEVSQKLLATFSSGSGAPDVSAMQGDEIIKYIEFGGLLDLTDRLGVKKDDFPKYKIDNDTGSDGKIYGVPIDCGPCGMFYQADLFQKSGVDPASIVTYEDWIAAGKKIKEAGYSLHRMTNTGDSGFLRMWTQQQNQNFFDEQGFVTLNTPKFVKSVTLLKKLYDSGTTADLAEWTPQYAEAVTTDKIATILGAAWYMNVFIHSFDAARGKNWKILPLPIFEGGSANTSNLGGSELIIPKQSKNQDAAWQFIEFYSISTEGKIAAMNSVGEFPAFLPTYQEQEVKDKIEPYFGDQKVYSFFAGLLPNVPSFKVTSVYPEIMTMLGAELPKLMSGELTPEAYAVEVQKKGEEIYKNYKK